MSARVRALVGLVVAVAFAVAVVPVAEASFPGRNGLLAFDRFETRFGNPTIWLLDPRSGRSRQLTHVPRRCARRYSDVWEDSAPSFSASGRFVVYSHRDNCDPRTRDGLYTIATNGQGRRRVPTESAFGGSWPALSPSGRSLAFHDFDSTTYITSVKQPRTERTLSFGPRRYFDAGAYAAWGPRGRLALVVGDPDTAHIATVSPDGKDFRLVTRSSRDATPDWSPDANRIVFAREKGDRSDILLARAGTRRDRRPKRLTHTRDAYNPVWSPNGRFIAFVRDLGFDSSVEIMRAQDGRGRRLLVNHVHIFSRISWQPRPRR